MSKFNIRSHLSDSSCAITRAVTLADLQENANSNADLLGRKIFSRVNLFSILNSPTVNFGSCEFGVQDWYQTRADDEDDNIPPPAPRHTETPSSVMRRKVADDGRDMLIRLVTPPVVAARGSAIEQQLTYSPQSPQELSEEAEEVREIPRTRHLPPAMRKTVLPLSQAESHVRPPVIGISLVRQGSKFNESLTKSHNFRISYPAADLASNSDAVKEIWSQATAVFSELVLEDHRSARFCCLSSKEVPAASLFEFRSLRNLQPLQGLYLSIAPSPDNTPRTSTSATTFNHRAFIITVGLITCAPQESAIIHGRNWFSKVVASTGSIAESVHEFAEQAAERGEPAEAAQSFGRGTFAGKTISKLSHMILRTPSKISDIAPLPPASGNNTPPNYLRNYSEESSHSPSIILTLERDNSNPPARNSDNHIHNRHSFSDSTCGLTSSPSNQQTTEPSASTATTCRSISPAWDLENCVQSVAAHTSQNIWSTSAEIFLQTWEPVPFASMPKFGLKMFLEPTSITEGLEINPVRSFITNEAQLSPDCMSAFMPSPTEYQPPSLCLIRPLKSTFSRAKTEAQAQIVESRRISMRSWSEMALNSPLPFESFSGSCGKLYLPPRNTVAHYVAAGVALSNAGEHVLCSFVEPTEAYAPFVSCLAELLPQFMVWENAGHTLQ